jgi:hypothetical protein
MKIDYNFITLVALGSFNPAIVSPNFLNTVCELNLGEPVDQSPPDILNVYYEKLPYTPLKAVGVNINCDLLAEMETKTEALTKKVSNPTTYLDFFDTNKINVIENSLQTKTDKTWMSSNYNIENVHGLTRSINVTQKKDFLNLFKL